MTVATTLWIDVEDLFEYALHNSRPSGIQRLAFQLCRALNSQYGEMGAVRFVRHNTARNTFCIVTWSEVAAVFDRLAADRRPATARSAAASRYVGRRRPLRALVHRLSPSLRASLIDAFRMQGRAFRAWLKLISEIMLVARSLARRLVTTSRRDLRRDAFGKSVAPGDVLLALGSPWSHPEYARLIRAQRERNGLRFGLLVYDLCALRHPEWFDHGLVRSFRAWFDDMLPLCDRVFAISRATAADVTTYACECGVELSGTVVPLPLGTSLADDSSTAGSPRTSLELPPGSYVLFTATIEARKNHMLLFRIWRRMLDEMPRDQVPTLVCVGRVGWLVDDLLQQIINTDYLSGRLLLIHDASDADLAALYRGCLFTLYPSFFEGWGLPVTESLAFGKPCLVSDRTSLPEAGGDLARYLDPDDLHGWYGAICQMLDDRSQLAAWEARIKREFRPVAWSTTVRALLAGLGDPLGEGAEMQVSGSRSEGAALVASR